MRYLPLILALLLLATPAVAQNANPAAEGFDMAGSDARAIELADAVMESMGGRENWDNTRYLSWSFVGDDQVWDKWYGDFRYQKEDLVVLMNVNSMEGRAWKGGDEVTDDAALEEQLAAAYRAWVNSGYWMIMPYKMKDSGVTLKYMGEGTMENGKAAEMVELTFKDTGLTPQNKYHFYINKETMLVEQWSYFPTAADTEPRLVRPMDNWKKYGNIMLSDGRGTRQDGTPFNMMNVGAYDSLPEAIFTDPAKLDMTTLGK